MGKKEKIFLHPAVGDFLFHYHRSYKHPDELEEFGVSMPTIRMAQYWVGFYEGLVPCNSKDVLGKGESLQFWRFFIELEKYAVEEIYKELHERFEIQYGPTEIPEQFLEELKDLIESQNTLIERLQQGKFSPITE